MVNFFSPIETPIVTAITTFAKTQLLTQFATLSMRLLSPNAAYAFVTRNKTQVPTIASNPIVTPIVAPIVTPMVTLVSHLGDTNASRASQCS